MAGTFADSNRASLRFLAEDANTWGSTPASGASREMRITSSKLVPKKDTKMSDEIRSDRMVPSIIEVGASASGDINFEFSAGAMDDFFAAFVYGLWSRPMSWDFFKGVGVAITGASTVVIQADVTGYFANGQILKTEGFTKPANNAYMTITNIGVSGSVSTLTISGPTLVAEGSSAFTKILDAGDVLVLNNTNIRFAANKITSNSTNAFSAAITAGQIKVGQKIWVDGVGRETGTVTINDVPTAGSRIIVNDSVKQAVFQFGGSLLPGYINVAAGAHSVEAGDNLRDAINAAFAAGLINVFASANDVSLTQVVTLTNLEITESGTITEAGDTGNHLAISDFSGGDMSTRGDFTITSVANDELGVSPNPGVNTNAGTKKVTIKGSMLRNPSAVTDFVRQSFSVETSFEDVEQHFVGTGMRVGTFDLNIKAGDILTGTLSFMGRAMQRRIDQTSLLRNSPYTNLQATANEVMNATVNVGDLTKNGSALSSAIQSITIKGDAALREQRAVGDKYAKGIGVGRFKLTGSFTAYFESGELFDDFVSHNTISLGFFVRDIDGNRYDFTLPAIKLTSDPVSPDGIDKDVVEDIEWEAQRDPATNCMIQVDRFSSTKAQSNS